MLAVTDYCARLLRTVGMADQRDDHTSLRAEFTLASGYVDASPYLRLSGTHRKHCIMQDLLIGYYTIELCRNISNPRPTETI